MQTRIKIAIAIVGALLLVGQVASRTLGQTSELIRVEASKVEEPAIEVTVEPAPEVPAPPKPDTAKLEAYLLEAMTKWAPASSMPKKDISHYPSIAKDITEVVLDPNEKPLWKGDEAKGRTAIMLAGLAFFESHYWDFVDRGRCNDYAWRKTREGRATMINTGDCDGGLAGSLWQIHGLGVVLTTDEYSYSWDLKGQKGLETADLIADRKLAARLALHMIRKSFRLAGSPSLCGYSGESGPCPKAKLRLDFAQDYSRKHPMK